MSKIGDYIIENDIVIQDIDEDCYLCGEDMSSSVFYIEPSSLCKRCSVTYKDALEERYKRHEERFRNG